MVNIELVLAMSAIYMSFGIVCMDCFKGDTRLMRGLAFVGWPVIFVMGVIEGISRKRGK